MPLDFKYAQTIGTAFSKSGYAKDKHASVVGLEYENETKDANFEFEHYPPWRFHSEGSLRHRGFEFVLSPPQELSSAKKSVSTLFTKLLHKLECTNSIRTSVHVHFDVTKYTYVEVINFALVYWLLEDVLSDFCGKYRKGNLFCLRASDSTYAITTIAQDLKRGAFFSSRTFLDNGYRYGSINFASLSKFGSLEFRMMRGVSKDNYQDSLFWVDCLEAVRKMALKFETPNDFAKFFYDTPAEKIPQVVLGVDLWEKLQPHCTEDYAEAIRSAFIRLLPIVKSRTDYTINPAPAKPKEDAEDIDYTDDFEHLEFNDWEDE